MNSQPVICRGIFFRYPQVPFPVGLSFCLTPPSLPFFKFGVKKGMRGQTNGVPFPVAWVWVPEGLKQFSWIFPFAVLARTAPPVSQSDVWPRDQKKHIFFGAPPTSTSTRWKEGTWVCFFLTSVAFLRWLRGKPKEHVHLFGGFGTILRRTHFRSSCTKPDSCFNQKEPGYLSTAIGIFRLTNFVDPPHISF